MRPVHRADVGAFALDLCRFPLLYGLQLYLSGQRILLGSQPVDFRPLVIVLHLQRWLALLDVVDVACALVVQLK